MLLKPMNFWVPRRTKAALIHLMFSMCIGAVAAALVFGVWYPYPYNIVAGGQELFTILLSVDVVLGPLLTLVIFNKAKPRRELFLDISLVAVIQLGALTYGLWTVYVARPVYVVHEVDRFQVITAADIEKDELEQALPEFRQLPTWGHRLIGVRKARSAEESMASLDLALAGKDVAMRPGWWVPIDLSHKAIMSQRGKLLEEVRINHPLMEAEIDHILKKRSLSPDQVRVFPLVARVANWSILIDMNSLSSVGYLPVSGFSD